jgi:bacillopeptidase F
LRSEQSKTYTIVLDTTAPTVTIDAPRDSEVMRGQTQRIVNFSGSVGELGSKVFIGERMVIVQSDGKFTLAYQLVEGDQEIPIKAVDKAGNENLSSIKLRWEP